MRSTLERCQQDHERLTAERDEVRKEIDKLAEKDRPSKFDLEAVDNRLKLIKSGEGDLLKHLTLLEKIEKEESDPKKKEWLIQKEQAKVLEKEAELGQAIAIYEKVPAEFHTAAAKKKKIEELKKLWKAMRRETLSSEAFHLQDLADPGNRLVHLGAASREEAFDALDRLQEKAADVIGPTKLLKITEKHVENIAKELDAAQAGREHRR